MLQQTPEQTQNTLLIQVRDQDNSKIKQDLLKTLKTFGKIQKSMIMNEDQLIKAVFTF